MGKLSGLWPFNCREFRVLFPTVGGDLWYGGARDVSFELLLFGAAGVVIVVDSLSEFGLSESDTVSFIKQICKFIPITKFYYLKNILIQDNFKILKAGQGHEN